MATAKSQLPFHMKGQTTCINHKGRQLDLYCENCQELVCLKCLSSIHKGHIVCELSEISQQRKHSIKSFIDTTEKNDLVQIRKYITSTDTLLKDNTTTFEKLSSQLKNQTDNLKKDLDMLTAQTISLYHKMEQDNTMLIQKYKQDLEMYDKQLKQQIQECKTALQRGSHIQIYDASCEIHSPNSLPVKPALGTASFTPNKNPHGHLEAALGKVITSDQVQTLTDQDRSVSTSDGQQQSSTQHQRSEAKGKKAVTKYKLQNVLRKTKVVGEWRPRCFIFSICLTTDGQMWASGSYTLFLLDRKGIVKQMVQQTSFIDDISLSPTTHTLWVCDRENNIMELVSGRLTHRFSTKEYPQCICVTASNHVIVGMAKHISKFTTQGQMVLTTMTKRTGKPSVCTPWRISECPVTHNVAVIDYNKERYSDDGNQRVAVMDADFKELFVYRGDIPSTYKQRSQTQGRPFYPRCVAYDSVGNLIIGDYNNYSVLLLSGGGEFIRDIHTDTFPTLAVGVDREGVLWTVFGHDEYNKVKLLQYSSV